MKYAYGLENDAPKYAPYAVKVGTTTRVTDSLTEEEAHSIGLKAVITTSPADPAPAGSHYEPDGWSEDAITITRKWKTVADPVIPRKWTRLKMRTAIAQAGWYSQVEAFLKNIEIAPSYNAWKAMDDCDYVEELWPDATTWNGLLDTVAANLGKTRAEIDAFIATVPTDPGATMEG